MNRRDPQVTCEPSERWVRLPTLRAVLRAKRRCYLCEALLEPKRQHGHAAFLST